MNIEISRRVFIGGAATSAITSGLWASTPARAESPHTLRVPRLPSGLQLRGVNHIGDPKDKAADYWGGLWETWDWDNWIRPQIDDIAGVGNAIRFWGNTFALAEGGITLKQYVDRWRQVLDYVHSIGLLVYPCGGDLRHWGDFSWKQSTDTYAELAGLLSGYPNVVGMDITNEASDGVRATPNGYVYDQPEPAVRLLDELGNIVRSAGLAITHSRSVHDREGWAKEFSTDHLGDYLDFHIYYPPAPYDAQPAYEQPWGSGKKLIIGEFGQNLSESTAEREGFYTAVETMCSNDPNCLGALAWSAWDQGSTERNQWGLFDENRNLRSDIGNVFLRFPTER